MGRRLRRPYFVTFLSLFAFALVEQCQHSHQFIPGHAPDRAAGIQGMDHCSVRLYQEFGRLDDAAALFAPPGAESVRLATGHAICDRERYIGARFKRLLFIVHTGGQKAGAKRFQLHLVLFQAGQLPAAIGSPVTAVKSQNEVFAADCVRERKSSPAGQLQFHGRKPVTAVEFRGHFIFPPLSPAARQQGLEGKLARIAGI